MEAVFSSSGLKVQDLLCETENRRNKGQTRPRNVCRWPTGGLLLPAACFVRSICLVNNFLVLTTPTLSVRKARWPPSCPSPYEALSFSHRAKECVAWQKLYSSNYSWALNNYSRKSVNSEVKMIGMINVYLLEENRIHLRDQLGACLWGIFRLELAGREHT